MAERVAGVPKVVPVSLEDRAAVWSRCGPATLAGVDAELVNLIAMGLTSIVGPVHHEVGDFDL